MPASSFPYRLEDLIPHRPPMVLLDEIVSFDESDRSLVAATTAREEWSENWAAIEYMAQAAAALAGVFDRLEDSAAPAKPGFLLGTRKLTLDLPRFEVGKRYLVTVRNEFFDDETASFACEIRDGDAVVASAILNAYRPSDIGAFLESQRRRSI